MKTLPDNPNGTPGKHNPLFRLVAKAEKDGLSDKQALQKALRTKFLSQVTTKHYLDVLNYVQGLSSTTDTYPRLLVAVTLQCARHQRIDRNLLFLLNFLFGGALLGASEWSAAAEHFLAAKNNRHPHLPLHLKQMCDLLLMATYFGMGNLKGMERLFCSETRDSQQLGKTSYVGIEALQAALMQAAWGNYEDAVKAVESVKGQYWLSEQYSFVFGITACLVYSLAGKIEKAIEYLKIPKDFQKPGFRIKLLDIYGTMLQGSLMGLGELDLASQLADALHELLESEGEVYGSLRWKREKADILDLAHRDDEALIIYEQILESFKEEGFESDAADCMQKTSRILCARGEFESALEMLSCAANILNRKGLRNRVARCEWDTGELLLEQGHYEEAYAIFCRVSPNVWGGFTFVRHLAMGEALVGMGQIGQARTAYEAGAESLESLIETLSMERHRHLYVHALWPTFVRLTDICLQECDFVTALEYVEKSKSRGLTEILRSLAHLPGCFTERDRREFKNALIGLRAYGRGFVEDKEFDALQAITADLPEVRLEYEEVSSRVRQRDPTFLAAPDPEITYENIRSLTDDRTALIELFPMEDRTVVFIVKHNMAIEDGVICVEGYGIPELFSDVDSLRKTSSVNQTKDVLDLLLKRLYEKVFARIQPLISTTEHLIFIPSSEFHLVPWHALYYEDKGSRKYIIDDHLVSYAPSAKILQLCLSRNQPSVMNAPFVSHANPDKGRKLSYSAMEARIVARYLGATPVLKANRADVIQQGETSTLVHYTGHADSESLELHSGKNEDEKEYFRLWEIVEELHLPHTSLAVLSACETGKIRSELVDEYIGLTSGFLMAGAATVISSLWSVPDLSTCLLMGRMYLSLKNGAGKAQALNEAQKWLRDSTAEDRSRFLNELAIGSIPFFESTSNESTKCTRVPAGPETMFADDRSHPYYWAGFICTGAP